MFLFVCYEPSIHNLLNRVKSGFSKLPLPYKQVVDKVYVDKFNSFSNLAKFPAWISLLNLAV